MRVGGTGFVRIKWGRQGLFGHCSSLDCPFFVVSGENTHEVLLILRLTRNGSKIAARFGLILVEPLPHRFFESNPWYHTSGKKDDFLETNRILLEREALDRFQRLPQYHHPASRALFRGMCDRELNHLTLCGSC